MASQRKFGSLQQSSANNDKEIGVLSRKKIHIPHETKETPLQQLKQLQRGQIDKVITEINKSLDSPILTKIIVGLNALNNILTTVKKQYFQSIAHQFILRVLTLICKFKYKVILESVVYLSKVASFGKLNKQCVELIIQIGVDIIIKKVKEGKKQQQCELFILVANLSIDSVEIRDFFIQTGAISVILQTLQQNQFHPPFQPNKVKFKHNAYSALIALSLGYPVPPRSKVERAVNKIVTDIENINSYWGVCPNQNTAVGAMWVLYHYFDYRDEEQCEYLLKQLSKLTFSFINLQLSIVESHFNQIFIQIYEYHSEKLNSGIMYMLHGCCYKGLLQQQIQSKVILRQYTPKMYIQLFREAIRHKMDKIGSELVRALINAFKILQEEKGQYDILSALEFISWVLSPLVKHDYYKSQLRPLQYQQKYILIYEIFPMIKYHLNIFIELRHDNRRQLGRMSYTILSKYRKNLGIMQGVTTNCRLSFQ